MRVICCVFAGLTACLLAFAPAGPTAGAGSDSLRVAVGDSFFHDMSAGLIKNVTEPFGDVMRETSGLKGDMVTGGDVWSVARQLEDGKVQLAVFHGMEFAWVHQKYADLRPLMIAAKDPPPRAYILVRTDSNLAAFGDLKGKDIGIPRRSKEHCYYFLNREVRQLGGKTLKDFFSRVVTGLTTEDTLDALAAGKVSSVLVDQSGMDFYKDLKPGVFAKLKPLAKSDVFPSDVIVYKQGNLDAKTQTRIRDGLRAAEKTDSGKDMMKTWAIASFEPVPKDFDQTMETSLKKFPPP